MKGITSSKNKPEIYTDERCFITEILNTEESPELSIAQARVRPGVTTALHRLLDTDEKYYILNGIGEMEIGGKITGKVQSGDLVIIPGNTTQRIRNLGQDDLVFLCLCTPRFRINNYESKE